MANKNMNTTANTTMTNGTIEFSKNIPAKLNWLEIAKECPNKPIPATIDGICCDGTGMKPLMLIDANDKEQIEFIQKIVDNSDKKGIMLILEIANQMEFIAHMNKNDVIPDEMLEVEVDGFKAKYTISFEKGEAYNLHSEKVADMSDLNLDVKTLPREAVIAILEPRVKDAIIKDIGDDDDDCDDCDDDCDDCDCNGRIGFIGMC